MRIIWKRAQSHQFGRRLPLLWSTETERCEMTPMLMYSSSMRWTVSRLAFRGRAACPGDPTLLSGLSGSGRPRARRLARRRFHCRVPTWSGLDALGRSLGSPSAPDVAPVVSGPRSLSPGMPRSVSLRTARGIWSWPNSARPEPARRRSCRGGSLRPERFLLYAAGRRLALGRYVDHPWLRLRGCHRFRGDSRRRGWDAACYCHSGHAYRVPRVQVRRRRRFLRHLRKARITALELKRRLDAGDHLVIVDLRTALDIERRSVRNPGSVPDRAGSAAAASPPDPTRQRSGLLLRGAQRGNERAVGLSPAANGFHNVHPLSGGLEGWRQAGFVVEPLKPVSS